MKRDADVAVAHSRMYVFLCDDRTHHGVNLRVACVMCAPDGIESMSIVDVTVWNSVCVIVS